MRARDLVGKTIAKVEQPRWESNCGVVRVLHRITFTDGTALMFVVSEGEGEYGVIGVYPAREHD